MAESGDKWKAIESEMDRFEAEISSLSKPAFVPSQLRKTIAPVTSAAPHLNKPTPVIISGAPQVYSSKPVRSVAPTITTIIRPLIHPHHATSTLSSSSSTSQANASTGSSAVRLALNSSAIPASPPALNSGTPATASPMPSSSIQTLSGTGDLVKPSTSGNSDNSSVADKLKMKKKKKKEQNKEKKPKKIIRCAGGTAWEDSTLLDWDTNDFRLFCGDLGNDVTDEVLTRVFGRYPSFQKAKVVRDKRTNKTKGYGFVSFKDPNDFVRAIKELDGRYVGSRPIKLRKSNWKNRNIDQARKRDKERHQLLGIKKMPK